MLQSIYKVLPEEKAKQLLFTEGEVIFKKGDKTQGAFIVMTGSVELRRSTPDGNSILIHHAKQGEAFAEISLFSSHYSCDAYATEDTTLTRLEKSAALKLMKNDPKLSLMLLHQFALQIEKYRLTIALLSIRNATDRVYYGFTEGLLGNNIKAFAADIGLSHEAVYRSLTILVKQGRLTKISHGKFALPGLESE